MEPEKISVIVITYNQKEYISSCLESILSQRISGQMEILVGDDASQDGTAEIVAQFARRYPEQIRPFLRRENVGASANIKELIELADGEYLAFCEGDDFWIGVDKLERQREALGTHAEWFGCVHNTQLVNDAGQPLKNQNLQWVRIRDVFTLQDFDVSIYPGHLSSLMIRNNASWKGLDKALLLCDRNTSDRMLFLMALRMGNIGRIPGTLSAYRFIRAKGGHSVMAGIYREKQSDVMKNMKMSVSMEAWLKEQGIFSKKFILSQSQLFVTAIFQRCKGYPVSLKKIWGMCNHKAMAICLLPAAFIVRLVQKGQIVFHCKVR